MNENTNFYKCIFCGANIDIKADVCPHCGMKKVQFEQHREDMHRFSADYEKTKEEAVNRNVRFTSRVTYALIISVLVAACLLVALAITQNNQIFRVVNKRKNEGNYNTVTAHLEELLEAEEYDRFYEYIEDLHLYSNIRDDSSRYSEYEYLYEVSTYYQSNMRMLYAMASMGNKNDFTYIHSEPSERAKQVQRMAESFSDLKERYEKGLAYEDERYPRFTKEAVSERRLETAHEMYENVVDMYAYCFHMSDEERDMFENGSLSQRISIMEERLDEIMKTFEEGESDE